MSTTVTTVLLLAAIYVAIRFYRAAGRAKARWWRVAGDTGTGWLALSYLLNLAAVAVTVAVLVVEFNLLFKS